MGVLTPAGLLGVITPSCGAMHQEQLWNKFKGGWLSILVYLTPVDTKLGGESLPDRDEINVSADTDTSCQRFLISLGRYQQEFHGTPHLANLMPILRSSKQKHEELRRAGPKASFQIGDDIRT